MASGDAYRRDGYLSELIHGLSYTNGLSHEHVRHARQILHQMAETAPVAELAEHMKLVQKSYRVYHGLHPDTGEGECRLPPCDGQN